MAWLVGSHIQHLIGIASQISRKIGDENLRVWERVVTELDSVIRIVR